MKWWLLVEEIERKKELSPLQDINIAFYNVSRVDEENMYSEKIG